MNKRLSALIPILPLHALESDDYQSEPKSDLVEQLRQISNLSLEASSVMLDMVEAILDSLSLLNRDELEQGRWAFVSYSAQVMGLSALATLAEPQAMLFKRNFWKYKEMDDNDVRDVLDFAEGRRRELFDRGETGGNSVEPMTIRLAHIVWALIKDEDGKFLFHRREEEPARETGQYGPLGGKMNESDLPKGMPMNERIKLLNFDSLADQVYDKCWENAVIREIGEEAAHIRHKGPNGLKHGEDYELELIENAYDSFTNCRGTGGVFGVTRYYVRLYQVHLTRKGYLKLKSLENYRLTWASVEEIGNDGRDGISLDIKGFTEQFRGGKGAFLAMLNNLPSYNNQFRHKGKTGILLAKSDGGGFCAFVASTGGANAKKTHAGLGELTKSQYGILLGLAAHLRGWEFKDKCEGLIFEQEGWVAIDPNLNPESGLYYELMMLHKLNSELIEKDLDSFRLSINPEVVYIDDTYFAISRVGEDEVVLRRCELNTPFGDIAEEFKRLSVPGVPKFLIDQLQDGKKVRSDKDSGAIKAWWKDKKGSSIGLWNLVSAKNGSLKLNASVDGDLS